MLGVSFLLVGLFGGAIVIAPAAVKLLFAGALLYAILRNAWEFSRA